MSRFYDKKYDKLTTYTPGEQPRNISEYIKLNTNESPFPPSPTALKLANDELLKLNLYPDPDAKALREEIASFYSIKPTEVAVFNGSDELLSFCFQILSPNGVAFSDVTYGFYPVYAKVFNRETKVFPLRSDFTIDVDDYKGFDGTVFIANPNATTGLALSLDKIRKLLNQDRDRLVVVDEAYVDFGTESAVSLIGEYDNLLVVQTMSKSRSFAGGRLGIAIACEEIINDLNRIRYCFNPYNVNRVSLASAVGAFRDKEYFYDCTRKIMENREYLKKELKALGFFVTDSSSNFILAGTDKIDGKQLYERLKEQKILVRHFNDGRVSPYVRITIGTREATDTLIKKIKDILEAL